jgi:hypothetical protein
MFQSSRELSRDTKLAHANNSLERSCSHLLALPAGHSIQCSVSPAWRGGRPNGLIFRMFWPRQRPRWGDTEAGIQELPLLNFNCGLDRDEAGDVAVGP